MKNYLPIGSVVTLKNYDRKVMIIGRSQISDKIKYDYSGVLFPDGYLGSNKLFVFNSDEIENLFYIGMQNEEELIFRKALAEAEEEHYDEVSS